MFQSFYDHDYTTFSNMNVSDTGNSSQGSFIRKIRIPIGCETTRNDELRVIGYWWTVVALRGSVELVVSPNIDLTTGNQ